MSAPTRLELPLPLALLLGLALACPAAASALQPLDAIAAAAAAAARVHVQERAGSSARLEIVAQAPDPRLRLPACGAPLVAAVPAGSNLARLTVEVRCTGPETWRLYVPVAVTVQRPVVIAARSLARDTILAPGDVRLADRDVAALPYGTYAGPELVVGQRLRREVAEGAVLTPGLVLTPPLVQRGQTVTLEARSPGFTVRTAGIARRDGRLGERIPVQNISSGEVREAVVRSAKSVEVLMR